MNDESRIERHFRWCVLVLIAAVILLVPTFFLPVTHEPGRVKVLVLHLAVTAMLGLMAIQSAWTGRLRLPRHSLLWAIGAWLLVNVASAVVSPYSYISLDDLWRTIMLAGLCVATMYAVRSLYSLRVLAWCSVVAVFLVMTYGLAQRMGHDVIRYEQSPENRLFASIGNPNMLAGYLILMIWVVVGLAVDSRKWSLRIGLAAVTGFLFWGLILTYTKGAWIALAVSIFICLAWFAIGRRFPFAFERRRKIQLLAVFAGVVLLAFFMAYRPIVGRLHTLKDSVAIRKVFWKGSVDLVRERPFFGAGAGTFQIRYPEKRPANFWEVGASIHTFHAHSEPLEILTELGIVGFLAWLWVLWAFYRGIFRTFSQESEHPTRGVLLGITMGITALLLHNLVDVNLRWTVTPIFLWFFLGLGAAAMSLDAEVASEENKKTADKDVIVSLPEKGILRWGMVFLFVAFLTGAVKTRVIDTWRSEICYEKGHRLLGHKQLDASFRQLTDAIALNPSNLRARYDQADCLYRQKKYVDTVRAYLHLEQLAPNYGGLNYRLASAYVFMGQWQESVERFVKAEKTGAAPKGFSAADHLAALYKKTPDPKVRLAVLKKVVELLPDDAKAHAWLGNYYHEREQLEEAVAEFETAIAIDAECFHALNNLTSIRYLQKDYPATIKLCRRILEIDPSMYQIRIHLGRAYLLNGEREKAVAEWQRVLQDHPDNPDVRKYLQTLASHNVQ